MANWLISAKPPITKGDLNENHVFILDILNDYRSLSLQVLNEWLGENQSFGAGSAESPSLKFTSGGGLFAPDTHSIAIASSGLTRLRIASTGSAVVGATAPTAGVGLDVSLAPTGAVNTVGVKVTGEVQPDVSTEHQAFSSYPKVKTGTTLAALTHYCASQPTLGGDVTTQAGFKVSDSLTGAENNYGFYGLLSAAAGRYNLYMSGTAKNFLQGNTGIGVLPDDTYTLKVYGQSYLPWVQSGADGVARDVATRLRDRCCVEDFGATGVDDDTDAFQSAIDWLPASGGTIWLTKEDYRIDGTLNAGTKLIKWANVRKINSLVHHGKLPGVTETFCSGAAGYYEIQRAVAKETDGYTLSVYRDANYTGTSATDTASVKSRLYLRSTIGTSGQTKVESGVSTDVVNESLYAAGYALAAYAKRTVDGRTVGIYCVADDYAAGAGLTKTTLSGDFELRCADTDANSMRTIMRLTAHSQNAVDYDEDAKISTGLRVRASTANLGVAIGVDQIGNAEIDTGLDLSDVEFESDAIAIRTDNWINLAGDEETRKGLRYNSSTQLIEVSKPFAVGTTSLCTNLNADLLDGQEGSYYRNADNLNAGTLPAARFNDTAHGSRSGGALHSGATAETAGFMTPAQVIKLDGIETGATADQTGQEILAALLPYDGSGSELDSDKLDGQQGSYYTDIPSRLGYTPVNKAGDTMTGLLYFSSITPGWRVSETDQGTDLKNWQFSAYNQKLYFQTLDDNWSNSFILATLDRSGVLDVTGYLKSQTGIRSKIPSSPWETSGTWIGISGYGQLYSPGSSRVGLYSNGYRNSSGQWTSFSVNGNTGASGIDLDPAGCIYVRCEANKPTGDTMDVDRVAFFSHTTGLNIDLGLKVTGTVAAKDRVAVGGESFWAGRGVVVQGSTVCTGSTSTMGYYSNVAIGNDVTTSHYQYYSYPSVASGTNTLGSLLHFAAAANTFGQTVTNQYGFYAGSTLTGATNNYGFYGNILSGTSRYNCYMSGTAYNYFCGNTGIGTLPVANYKCKVLGDVYIDGDLTVTGEASAPAQVTSMPVGSATEPSLNYVGDTNTGLWSPGGGEFAGTCDGVTQWRCSTQGFAVGESAPAAGEALSVNHKITGATTAYGVIVKGEVQTDVTGSAVYFRSHPTLNSRATVTNLIHFQAACPSTPGGTITTQYGFYAAASLDDATNNYGFYGALATGYNLYMSGAGKNYLYGQTGIGVAPDDAHRLKVTGKSYLNGNTGINVAPDDTYGLKVTGRCYLPWAQGGAGSPSTRDVETVLRERVVSVKDYGAVGDGSTDDYTAIQNAINNNPGRTIWFPKGVYKINTGLTVKVPGVSLVGESFGAKVFGEGYVENELGVCLKWGGTTGVVVDFRSETAGQDVSGVLFKNFHIDCQGQSCTGLRTVHVSASEFCNFKISNLGSNAIGLFVTGDDDNGSYEAPYGALRNTYDCTFHNFYIVDNNSNATCLKIGESYGVDQPGQHPCMCHFYNYHLTHHDGIGIDIRNNDDCTFHHFATSLAGSAEDQGSGDGIVLRATQTVGGKKLGKVYQNKFSDFLVGHHQYNYGSVYLYNITANGLANNEIRVTTTAAHGFVTNDRVDICRVKTVTGVNGRWTITKINDTTFDLQGSYWLGGSYIPGSNEGELANCLSAFVLEGYDEGENPPSSTYIEANGGDYGFLLLVGRGAAVTGEKQGFPTETRWVHQRVHRVLFEQHDPGSTTGVNYDGSNEARNPHMLDWYEESETPYLPAFTGSDNTSKPISNVSNYNGLIKITTSTSHGFTTGEYVWISGVRGVPQCRGLWAITYLSSTTFILNDSHWCSKFSYISGGAARIAAQPDSDSAMSWTRIGNRVFWQCRLQVAVSGIGDVSGSLMIRGLPPFTVSYAAKDAPANISKWQGINLSSGYTELSAYVDTDNPDDDGPVIRLVQSGSNKSTTAVTKATNLSPDRALVLILGGNYETYGTVKSDYAVLTTTPF